MSIYSWTMYNNQSVLLYKSKLEFLSLFMSHLSFKTRSRKLNLCIEAKHILGIYGKHLGWDSLMKTLNPKIRRRQLTSLALFWPIYPLSVSNLGECSLF
jgi:hypothetical protein